MDDDPDRFGRVAPPPVAKRDVGQAFSNWPGPSYPGEGGETETLSLLEEVAVVSKRRVVTGSVRLQTRTEFRQESTDLILDRHVVDVTHVPVNRLIEDAPDVRTEGDTTIVPIVEERFVVVKQLFLKEELHIRRRSEPQTVQHSETLRRQSAVVERFDPEGRIVVGPGDGRALVPAAHAAAS